MILCRVFNDGSHEFGNEVLSLYSSIYSSKLYFFNSFLSIIIQLRAMGRVHISLQRPKSQLATQLRTRKPSANLSSSQGYWLEDFTWEIKRQQHPIEAITQQWMMKQNTLYLWYMMIPQHTLSVLSSVRRWDELSTFNSVYWQKIEWLRLRCRDSFHGRLANEACTSNGAAYTLCTVYSLFICIYLCHFLKNYYLIFCVWHLWPILYSVSCDIVF